MSAPEPSARGLRLASRDRADHPHAVPLGQCVLHPHIAGGERCEIKRAHEPHPYGAIHPGGGLAHWCKGRS